MKTKIITKMKSERNISTSSDNKVLNFQDLLTSSGDNINWYPKNCPQRKLFPIQGQGLDQGQGQFYARGQFSSGAIVLEPYQFIKDV